VNFFPKTSLPKRAGWQGFGKTVRMRDRFSALRLNSPEKIKGERGNSHRKSKG